MKKLKKSIDKQLEFNQDKNILLENPDLLRFTEETIASALENNNLDPGSRHMLINYAADKTMEAFYRVNQYYSFDADAKDELRGIYADLLDGFCSGTPAPEDISRSHYDKLRKWLKKSNPFSEKIYAGAGNKIEPVPCAEYSQALQVDVLRIDAEQVMQPVLDVGCGSNAYLVKYLASQGLEVYGIDRCSFGSSNLMTADWLEFKYGTQKWGTIISNLGFSNHFNHHHLRADGNYIAYAKTYMNILHSLKIGGTFHYAPDLPFIEMYLDKQKFSVEKHDINDCEFRLTIITRLQ